MKRIKQGDEVIVLTGRDKRKRGRVREVLPDGRLLITGIAMVKRHTKPNPAINRQGGIVDKESPVHPSNVALFNPESGRGGKTRFVAGENGRRNRVFRLAGAKGEKS